MNVYVLLMWLSLALSTGLIVYILVNRGSLSRRLERESALALERELRREQVLAIASLASGTAQEMGSPMTTMSVLLDEMAAEETDPRRQENYRLLIEQIRDCKTILDSLTRTARLTEPGEAHKVDIVDFTQSIVNQWLTQRTDADARFEVSGEGENPWMTLDLTLGQALENLLDNAANAWSRDILVDLDWDDSEVSISVTDKGPGIPEELIEKLGRPVIRKGHVGLGLLLSHATAMRYGGLLELENPKAGGARATLSLPRTRS